MVQTRIEVNENHFSVEYEEKNGWLEGNVYAVVRGESAVTGQTDWSYLSKTHGGETHETLNDDCRNLFSFLFVWRGVWEGRIYFQDDEYWSEELSMMTGVWNQLEPQLKEVIRKANPNTMYDD